MNYLTLLMAGVLMHWAGVGLILRAMNSNSREPRESGGLMRGFIMAWFGVAAICMLIGLAQLQRRAELPDRLRTLRPINSFVGVTQPSVHSRVQLAHMERKKRRPGFVLR
jgi:hypothetical protein